jgi:hypothetical protein
LENLTVFGCLDVFTFGEIDFAFGEIDIAFGETYNLFGETDFAFGETESSIKKDLTLIFQSLPFVP